MKILRLIIPIIFSFMLLTGCDDVNEEVGDKIEGSYNQSKKQDVRDFWLDSSDYDYEVLDSLDDWTDDGKAKVYWTGASWSGEELIELGHMIFRYPNGNIETYINHLGIDEYYNIVVDGVQKSYYENGEISKIRNIHENIKDGLFVNYDEDGKVDQIQYYDNGELVIDSTQPGFGLDDELIYYKVMSDNMLYCVDGFTSLSNSRQSKMYINEGKSALDVCRKTIKVAKIIGDYNGDSSLKDAMIHFMSGSMYAYEMFIKLKEIELNKRNGMRNQDTDTEIVQLKEKILEANGSANKLYDEVIEARDKYVTRYLSGIFP